MTKGENVLIRSNVCLSCLQDFFDSLIDDSCPDPYVLSLVSSSLLKMKNLLAYAKVNMKFSD